MDDTQVVAFTPVAVLQLLAQIEELKDADITLGTQDNGGVQFTINNHTYRLVEQSYDDINVNEDIMEDILECEEEGYDTLDQYNEGQVDLAVGEDVEDIEFYEDYPQEIEGGILTSAIKSLALGGIIRFAKNKLLD